MSTIQLEIACCNCCNIDADLCEVTQKHIKNGVDPDWITHIRLCPQEEDVNDLGLYTRGTKGIG